MKVGLIAATALATVVVTARSHACECIIRGVSVWPPSGTTIPTNGIVVLRGIASQRDLVGYIDEQRPALSCGERTIALRLKDLFVGVYAAEALLVPARRLPPLTRCELVLTARRSRSIEPVTWFAPFDLLNEASDAQPVGPARAPWWTTAVAPDHRPPTWTATPRWTDPPRRGPSCNAYPGEVSAKASAAAADAEGPILIRALLDDGRQKNDFLVAPNHDAVDLGNNLCGGAFAPEEGREYRVTFSALDAAGNVTRAPGRLPSLTGPTSTPPDPR